MFVIETNDVSPFISFCWGQLDQWNNIVVRKEGTQALLPMEDQNFCSWIFLHILAWCLITRWQKKTATYIGERCNSIKQKDCSMQPAQIGHKSLTCQSTNSLAQKVPKHITFTPNEDTIHITSLATSWPEAPPSTTQDDNIER
jgi:hypothetical protein